MALKQFLLDHILSLRVTTDTLALWLAATNDTPTIGVVEAMTLGAASTI